MRRGPRVPPAAARSALVAAVLLLCLATAATGQRWIWDIAGPQDSRSPPVRADFAREPDLRYPGVNNWPLPRPSRRPGRLRPSTPAPSPTRAPAPVPTRAPSPAPSPSPAPTRLVDGVGAPLNCTCPATHEFNPVCGTNGATYNSPIKLRCAQRCGYDVEMAHYGNCPRQTSGK